MVVKVVAGDELAGAGWRWRKFHLYMHSRLSPLESQKKSWREELLLHTMHKSFELLPFFKMNNTL